MLNDKQIDLLIQYRDKSYVMNVLLERSFEFYSLIKSVCNVPLILISSVMAILNSGSFDANEMKTPNIVINGCTAMMLAMISNFKISEKETIFKSLSIKMLRLCHKIEDILTNSLDTTDADDMRMLIAEYDQYIEQIEHGFPFHIKEKVKKIYAGKKTMPAFLNCETNQFTRPSSNLTFQNAEIC
jgi:hypothetical protein